MPASTSRRGFLVQAVRSAAVPVAASSPATAMASSNAPTEAHTSSTPLIDAAHPRIAQLAAELTRDADDATDAAVRVHDWVRDRVAFGIAPAFYAMRASEVLAAGVGYCNTKTTLFSALLRAAGIPTRTRMFDLSADVLRGLFDPGSESVDHAVTEVWLDGRWIGVDSYVVDTPLARAATARLVSEGRQAGYGIHLAGTSSWDGRAGARIQCVESGAAATSVRADHGVFGDVADFYGRVPQARNRLGIVSALLIRFGAAGINRSINAVRQAGAG